MAPPKRQHKYAIYIEQYDTETRILHKGNTFAAQVNLNTKLTIRFRRAPLAGSVDISAVLDPVNHHHLVVFRDCVDDAIVASPGRPEPLELTNERLPQPAWVLGRWPGVCSYCGVFHFVWHPDQVALSHTGTRSFCSHRADEAAVPAPGSQPDGLTCSDACSRYTGLYTSALIDPSMACSRMLMVVSAGSAAVMVYLNVSAVEVLAVAS